MTPRVLPGLAAVAVTAAAPWAFGATDPSWAAALAAACLAAIAVDLVADTVRPGPWDRSWRLAVCVPLVAALGLLPLPSLVRAVMAPSGTALLAVADPDAVGGWRASSLAPHATLSAVALAGAYAGAFLLVLRLARAPGGRTAATALLTASGVALAVFGMVQHLTQPGDLQPRIYWTIQVYEAGTPFGPYVNRNHFAGAMVVLGAIAAGEALAASAERRRPAVLAYGGAALAMLAALAHTTSRGGLLAAFVAAAVLVAAAPAGRRLGGIAAAAGVAALVAAILAWTGVLEALAGRLVHLNDRWMNRFGVQRDALAAFAGNPVLGTGAGSFEEVFPAFQRLCDDRSFTNAHSDWAQLLMETGLAGAAVAASVARAFLRRVAAGLGAAAPVRWRVVGPAAGVAGIAAHGFFDVNLHVPANALLTVSALSLAWAASPEPGAREAAGTG